MAKGNVAKLINKATTKAAPAIAKVKKVAKGIKASEYARKSLGVKRSTLVKYKAKKAGRTVAAGIKKNKTKIMAGAAGTAVVAGSVAAYKKKNKQ
jgi:hypothetical protein